MKTKRNTEIIVKNNIDELSVLYEKIEQLADEMQFSPALTMNLNLVLEEAVSNIIFYAFEDQNEHLIYIALSLSGEEENATLKIIIRDDGRPFDPTANDDPDVSLAVEDRPIGGLGIFLVRRIMDQVTYNRENNYNILTLIKNIGK